LIDDIFLSDAKDFDFLVQTIKQVLA